MRFRHGFAACSLLLASFTLSAVAPTAGPDERRETAAEIAMLFRSARAVLSANQDLINDPTRGDKGLDPEAVLVLVAAKYKESSGHELPEPDDSLIGQAQLALLAAIEKVMSDAQPLINEPGKGFKGFLPAVFARQVADDFSTRMAGKARIKLTAPRDIVRNRKNRPDEWESAVFETRFRAEGWKTGEAFAEPAPLEGKPAFRFLLPEYYQASCLACHGEPKGVLDVTGGKMEGLKLGDLGGAISVTLFD